MIDRQNRDDHGGWGRGSAGIVPDRISEAIGTGKIGGRKIAYPPIPDLNGSVSGSGDDREAFGYETSVSVMIVGQDVDPHRSILVGGSPIFPGHGSFVDMRDADAHRRGIGCGMSVADTVAEAILPRISRFGEIAQTGCFPLQAPVTRRPEHFIAQRIPIRVFTTERTRHRGIFPGREIEVKGPRSMIDRQNRYVYMGRIRSVRAVIGIEIETVHPVKIGRRTITQNRNSTEKLPVPRRTDHPKTHRVSIPIEGM